MRGKSVLFVLPTLGLGGSEGHVAQLARGVVRAGGKATVVCLIRSGPRAEGLARDGVEVVVVGLPSVFDPRAPARILACTLARRPSVVHAFLFGFDAVAAGPARLARVPAVVGSRRELEHWMRPRHRAVQAVGTALVDRVVCCAEAVRSEALAREGGAPEKYVVIRNGVEVARPTPGGARRQAARAALALGAEEIAVVTVANFEMEKGHEHLLAAIRQVAAFLPAHRFLWAGEGPRRTGLMAAASAAGMAGRIRFLGRVEDVATLLAGADLFVLPSILEGLPNAVLEAMAGGLPVVATRTGGVPEAVEDGVSGDLVPPGDPAALAAAIRRHAADRGRGEKMGVLARERVLSRFSPAVCQRAHHQLYLELVG